MSIFSNSSKSSVATPTTEKVGEVPMLRYPKPKILLLDLPSSASSALIAAGFNLQVGSLGKPYKVAKSSAYLPLIGLGIFPNHTEQEIIVIDLHFDNLESGPDGEKHTPDEEPDYWAKCNLGFIDPRPRNAMGVKEVFDRAHSAGGVFVVFAAAKTSTEIQVAKKQYRELVELRFKVDDEWSFVSETADMVVRDDHGYEMEIVEDGSSLARLVSEHLQGGEFDCTLEGGYRSKLPWTPLVQNKFGDCVGLYRCRGPGGSVIVLPQIANKAEFLVKLFTEVLPELSPHLFPSIEEAKWTHRQEYELPRVLELKARAIEIEEQAKQEIASLEVELDEERTKNGWMHALLTATGDPLVEAVKRSLASLGFQKVMDIDKERDREGRTRREDLQIEDTSPLLIVDIKGISNFPTDEDALQASKHAMIRMRELGRTDIDGLSIVNHQRHLPPLDRNNAKPFRQELIDAAIVSHLGLMTTWDLYRIVVNSQKLAWRANNVRPIFYKKGRIDVIPADYIFLGTVVKVWTEKFGVVIDAGELRIGDRIAIEFAIEFEESPVESIFVDGKEVDVAIAGNQTGINWAAERPKLREGMRVFRIFGV